LTGWRRGRRFAGATNTTAGYTAGNTVTIDTVAADTVATDAASDVL